MGNERDYQVKTNWPSSSIEKAIKTIVSLLCFYSPHLILSSLVVVCSAFSKELNSLFSFYFISGRFKSVQKHRTRRTENLKLIPSGIIGAIGYWIVYMTDGNDVQCVDLHIMHA